MNRKKRTKRSAGAIKIVLFLLFALAAIVLLVVLLFRGQNSFYSGNYDIPTTKPDKTEEELLTERIEAILSEMTLDQKIAQLLIVQPTGITIDDDMRTRLSTAPYGGFILMESNYGTLSETRNFVQDLRDASKYPLIISTDHEGGNVQRMHKITSPHATDIMYMSTLGELNNKKYTREVGQIISEELSAVGINVDYAPVMDINSNPKNPIIGKRSFSSSPDVVSEMGLALADGLAKNHVTATFKHFPGHGDTSVDSHKTLPILYKTRAELETTELVPFKAAIANGAEMIMVAHIALPNITGDTTPASLSHKITTELLRDELGYDGLIVTDGMNMGALANNYPEVEIYYRAVDAGADLLLLPSHPDLAIDSIKTHISEERINESVRRILRYKYGSMAKWQRLSESAFGSADHQAIINRYK